MEELTNLVNICDLDENEKPLKVVHSKPFLAHIIVAICGIGFIILKSTLILGIVLVLIDIAAFIIVKDRIQLKIYQDYFVVFLPDNKTQCQLVHFDEIKEWTCRPGKVQGDMIIIRLKNDNFVYIESYNSQELVHILNKRMPQLESNAKARAERDNSVIYPWQKKKREQRIKEEIEKNKQKEKSDLE